MKNAAILLLSLTLISCNAQEKEKEKPEKEKLEISVLPKEKWEVRKKYDEHGNLIRYDSVYSWKYSDVEGKAIEINLDSIMDTFRKHFENTATFKWEDNFSYFPKTDSLLTEDFFRKDYYLKNWERQRAELEKYLKQVDSSRNEFLKKYHPGLMESKEKK